MFSCTLSSPSWLISLVFLLCICSNRSEPEPQIEEFNCYKSENCKQFKIGRARIRFTNVKNNIVLQPGEELDLLDRKDDFYLARKKNDDRIFVISQGLINPKLFQNKIVSETINPTPPLANIVNGLGGTIEPTQFVNDTVKHEELSTLDSSQNNEPGVEENDYNDEVSIEEEGVENGEDVSKSELKFPEESFGTNSPQAQMSSTSEKQKTTTEVGNENRTPNGDTEQTSDTKIATDNEVENQKDSTDQSHRMNVDDFNLIQQTNLATEVDLNRTSAKLEEQTDISKPERDIESTIGNTITEDSEDIPNLSTNAIENIPDSSINAAERKFASEENKDIPDSSTNTTEEYLSPEENNDVINSSTNTTEDNLSPEENKDVINSSTNTTEDNLSPEENNDAINSSTNTTENNLIPEKNKDLINSSTNTTEDNLISEENKDVINSSTNTTEDNLRPEENKDIINSSPNTTEDKLNLKENKDTSESLSNTTDKKNIGEEKIGIVSPSINETYADSVESINSLTNNEINDKMAKKEELIETGESSGTISEKTNESTELDSSERLINEPSVINTDLNKVKQKSLFREDSRKNRIPPQPYFYTNSQIQHDKLNMIPPSVKPRESSVGIITSTSQEVTEETSEKIETSENTDGSGGPVTEKTYETDGSSEPVTEKIYETDGSGGYVTEKPNEKVELRETTEPIGEFEKLDDEDSVKSSNIDVSEKNVKFREETQVTSDESITAAETSVFYALFDDVQHSIFNFFSNFVDESVGSHILSTYPSSVILVNSILFILFVLALNCLSIKKCDSAIKGKLFMAEKKLLEKSVEKNKVSELSEENEQLKKENGLHKSELNKLACKISALQEEETELKKNLEEYRTKYESLQEASNKKNIKKNYELLMGEVIVQKKKLDDLAAGMEERAEILKQEKANIESLLKVQADEHAKVVNDYRMLLNNLELENKELREIVQTMSVDNEATQKLLEAVALQVQVSNLEKENENLSHQLEGEREAHKLLEDHQRMTQKEVNDLRENYEVSLREKVDLGNKLKYITDYFQQLEDKLKKEIAVKDDLLNEKLGDDDSLAKALMNLRKDNSVLSEENNILRSKYESLKVELTDQKNEEKLSKTKLENEREQIWMAWRAAERKIESLNLDNKVLRSKLITMGSKSETSFREMHTQTYEDADKVLLSPTSSVFMDHTSPVPQPFFMPSYAIPPPPLTAEEMRHLYGASSGNFEENGGGHHHLGYQTDEEDQSFPRNDHRLPPLGGGTYSPPTLDNIPVPNIPPPLDNDVLWKLQKMADPLNGSETWNMSSIDASNSNDEAAPSYTSTQYNSYSRRRNGGDSVSSVASSRRSYV